MIFTMLVGAWFLIHHHCCFADAGSPRSIMVDPLMRRSPLEKNFIRFGRSWGQEPQHVPDNDDPKPTNYWAIDQREVRGKENFIRFGRTSTSRSSSSTRDDWDPTNDSPLLTANDLERLSKFQPTFINEQAIIPRMLRSKQNFIRFGRSNAILNKNKKYSGHNKDNFIRFGRANSEGYNKDSFQSGMDDEYVGRETRGKEKGKNSGFIRFGKSADRFPEDRRDKRSVSSEQNDCHTSADACKSCFLNKSLDPTSLVAPEFSLLPKIPFQHPPLKKNFIRLG